MLGGKGGGCRAERGDCREKMGLEGRKVGGLQGREQDTRRQKEMWGRARHSWTEKETLGQ